MGVTVHSGTGGTFRRCFRKGFEMACSEGGFRAGFRDRCHTPKTSEGGSVGASKRASGRASGWLRRFYRSGASGIRVTLRKAPKGSFGVARPEGVFEGVFREGWFRRGLRRLFSRGCLRKGFPRGSSKEVAKGSSGRVLRAGFGRWIEDLRPGWAS